VTHPQPARFASCGRAGGVLGRSAARCRAPARAVRPAVPGAWPARVGRGDQRRRAPHLGRRRRLPAGGARGRTPTGRCR